MRGEADCYVYMWSRPGEVVDICRDEGISVRIGIGMCRGDARESGVGELVVGEKDCLLVLWMGPIRGRGGGFHHLGLKVVYGYAGHGLREAEGREGPGNGKRRPSSRRDGKGKGREVADGEGWILRARANAISLERGRSQEIGTRGRGKMMERYRPGGNGWARMSKGERSSFLDGKARTTGRRVCCLYGDVRTMRTRADTHRHVA